jgi:hypothetical protein
MKTKNSFKKSLWLLIVFFTLTSLQSYAQDQTFLIMKSYVKPSKKEDFKIAMKNIISEMKAHNHERSYSTIYLSDGSYITVSPIQNMADLDADWFKGLPEKVGKNKWEKIIFDINACSDISNNSLVQLKRDLSYYPKGESFKDYIYQNYIFLHFQYNDYDKITDQIKKIKKMFEDKNSKMPFEIYTSGFGTTNDYFVIHLFAKDEKHLQEMADTNIELMGNDFTTELKKLYAMPLKMDELTGWTVSSLSYFPSK